jgi:hypothetical protein
MLAAELTELMFVPGLEILQAGINMLLGLLFLPEQGLVLFL